MRIDKCTKCEFVGTIVPVNNPDALCKTCWLASFHMGLNPDVDEKKS